MDSGFSVSLNPIAPWPFLVVASAAVVGLTIAAYARKLRGPGASWRWVALGLRLFALLLCLLAALRPSVILQEKKKQAASIVFLLDSSTSMKIQDEANSTARWKSAREALKAGVEAAKKLSGDLEVKAYGFDSAVRDLNLDEEAAAPPEPDGRETQLGSALLEIDKRQAQGARRIARLVVLSDFGSNNGTNPLVAARRYRDQQTPVSTVVFGTQGAGAGSRDVAVREITAGPTVFVKNKLEVRGALSARGFGGQTLDVELFVEDQPTAVAKAQVKVPDGADSVPITGLNYIPQTPGEKKVTLKVAPREGELVLSNNEISTFVTVLSGGLNVLFVQGPNFTWDYKYLMNSIGTSPDIEVKGALIRKPAVGDKGELDDDEFTPGRYDVYVVSDMPADFLTPRQHHLLADAIKKGAAGMIMLGGRNSFGPGGWGRTEIADVLPVEVHPGDGQIEPPGGVQFKPNAIGLNSYLLQIGSDPANTARLWEALKPVQGTNRFGEPKRGAEILGTANGVDAEPMMLSIETGRGRTIAYGGDTWVWARTELGRPAHRKFWRQVVFWLSHKENQGSDQIKLSIDRRRAAVGQSVEMTIAGRDAKGGPLKDVDYDVKVEREGEGAEATSEAVEDYIRGDESLASYPARGKPGDYKVTVIGRRNGQEVGRDTARFLVYQDDRELENPSADPELARQIAEITAGEPVPPEQLAKHLAGLDKAAFTEYVSPTEHRVWDNWPFFLLFTLCLTLEWWLRKRHGWV
ncbi:glutamine amidotransferase [Paludisphaera mucosa]|uniref:Glutamine amidotransferase n=1 Tax=Paludisphaera mucosa TaxID=3030827 RepID=A0ABT6FII5_9BACT|nr:glutamine amidotransferase [Paludisphaera mucosa]MDG3007319.1 glutamine amidotransferase [Paludisphaera mucosa]